MISTIGYRCKALSSRTPKSESNWLYELLYKAISHELTLLGRIFNSPSLPHLILIVCLDVSN